MWKIGSQGLCAVLAIPATIQLREDQTQELKEWVEAVKEELRSVQ
jgi:hypothetical protein